MANFETNDNLPSWASAHDNMLCPKCGQHGRCSLNITIFGNKGECYHPLKASVCVYCNDGAGRLESLFTGTPSHPDYGCHSAQLPVGVTLTMLHKALIKHPLRRTWSQAELDEFRGGLYD